MQGKTAQGGRPKTVIVGGGFAGLSCARVLGGADTDVTLVDQRNYHLFQPLLYQAATALIGPSDIAWPIRSLLRRHKNIRTLLGTVVGVDRECRIVLLEGGEAPPFGYLSSRRAPLLQFLARRGEPVRFTAAAQP